MNRTEYEVKVAYDGDDLILTHPNPIRDADEFFYDGEEFTAADAAKDLVANLYGIEPWIETSAEIPGGKLYLIVEATPDDEYRPSPTVGGYFGHYG
jgi:hypothetical protein